MTRSLIEGAAPRTVTKRDGSSFTLFEVTIDGQKYVARKAVYDEAQAFIGQAAEVTTRSERNGNFTNFYLDAITPAPQARAASDYNEDPEKTLRIARQTASKVAAILSGDDRAAFWSNCDDLVAYYMDGIKPGEDEQYAAYGENGTGQGQLRPDEEIPF
jgi:hypothetical protein